MGVNSLPKTATRQRRDCDSNPCSSEHANHSATEPPNTCGVCSAFDAAFAKLLWPLVSLLAGLNLILNGRLVNSRVSVP